MTCLFPTSPFIANQEWFDGFNISQIAPMHSRAKPCLCSRSKIRNNIYIMNSRRNALHRALDERKLKKYGIVVNCDARLIISAFGTTYVPPYSTRKECEREINRHIRAIEGTQKLQKYELAEKLQKPLF